jgi:hypothetical protein
MTNIMITDVKEIQELFQQYGFGDTFEMGCGDLKKIDNNEEISTHSIKVDDIESVISYDEGQNDGDNWIFIIKTYDGRYVFMSAGADYTGFGCQQWLNNSDISYSLTTLINFSLTDEDRSRLNADAILIHLEKEQLEEVIKDSSKSNTSMKI